MYYRYVLIAVVNDRIYYVVHMIVLVGNSLRNACIREIIFGGKFPKERFYKENYF